MNSHGLPGQAESFWITSTPDTEYPPLQGNLTVDAAIIGGGFAGIISAYFLKQSGLKVAVVEADRIAKGATGYTTAKITSLHRLVYHDLVSKFGKERARQYADSNQAAIDKIESLVKELNIDCDFTRLPFYTYALNDEALPKIEKEVKAAQSLKLPASFVPEIPLPLKIKGAVRFDNQAQFHPRRFLLKLAELLPGSGSYIFEKSRVINLEQGETVTVLTDRGQLQARHLIIATGFPVFDKPGLYFARLYPSRAYALGVKIEEPFPEGMFIDAEESGYAWRSQSVNGSRMLIFSGGSHKTGHGDAREQYLKLEQGVRQTFDRASIEYSWSTQDSISLDGAPYIGLMNPLGKNVYVATGFAKWGMTTSVVAGWILKDLILGKTNPWAPVYNPSRFQVSGSTVKTLLSRNTRVIETFLKERLAGAPDISRLPPGEGKVVEVHGKRLAVYKDEQGIVCKISPNCTHMGCLVHWNNAEKTWDCPCHGSRYRCTGEVINSPAIKGLSRVEE